MGALRTARGYTGRNRVVIVEGGFHGLTDEMMWKSDVEGWDGSADTDPEIIPFGAGIPASTNNLVDFIPLNSVERLQSLFAEKGDDIAAVLLEPIMGNCGSISATQEWMELLRQTCTEYGTMLVIDEVKTGFRVAKGGAQELYGVYADLTTYAKAMGNGYPVACFGGRAEVMDVIGAGGGVVHGGTYTTISSHSVLHMVRWMFLPIQMHLKPSTVLALKSETSWEGCSRHLGLSIGLQDHRRCLGFILGTMYRPIIEIGKSPIVSCMLPSLGS